VGVAVVFQAPLLYGVPLLAAVATHSWELHVLRFPAVLGERLVIVGLRNLAWVMIQMALVIVVMRASWPGQ
jgi:hypothetical protein